MIEKTTYNASIKLREKEKNYIDKLLEMTGGEIYEEYGLNRDETITHTVLFHNGYEADIKLVIGDECDYPYTEGVLFTQEGSQVVFTEPCDFYTGLWEFITSEIVYRVTVE